MKSLSKALNILTLFLNQDEQLTLSQIAELSGISRPTTHRTLSVLVKHGFLLHLENRGKYSLGTIYLEFSGVIKSRQPIRNVAIPYLTKLAQQVHESVHIAYGDGSQDVFLETINEPSRADSVLQVRLSERTKVNLFCTGLGKVILADMSDGELLGYFNSTEIKPYTPNTITDIETMKKHLAVVRKAGVAFDYEESTIGVRSVAAGIRGASGKLLGSFDVVAPSVRMPPNRMLEIATEVKKMRPGNLYVHRI
jgi:Transcriptional regulator